MTERLVVEFHSERDKAYMLEELESMGYVVGAHRVKVCGLGMCGLVPIYGK